MEKHYFTFSAIEFNKPVIALKEKRWEGRGEKAISVYILTLAHKRD